MSLPTLIQHCLTGVSLGGAYALIAIGYTMVYGILEMQFSLCNLLGAPKIPEIYTYVATCPSGNI